MSAFWRKCRFAFRCCRFAVWSLVLLVLAVLLWCDFVGVPNFLKSRLVTALHERGVQLEFTRMRYNLVYGILCDNVRIGAAQETGTPVLTAREVQVRLNYPALFHCKLQVDGLVLRQGDFIYPLSENDSLSITNLQTELRFEEDDTWALDRFQAGLVGAKLTLDGEIKHAPEFRNWQMFASAKNANRGSVESSLKNFSDTLKKIHFDGQPQLNAHFGGDARDIRSITFTISVHAPAVETPWFGVHALEFTAQMLTPTNIPLYTDTAWGFWTNLQPFHLDWTAHGSDLKLPRFSADAVDCSGIWNAPKLSITKLSAQLGGGALEGTAGLDVATRNLDFSIHSGFDPHAVADLLAEKIRARLGQISWPQPPQVNAAGMIVMPPWNNPPPSWFDDAVAGARVHGELAFTNAVWTNAAVPYTLHTHFDYGHQIWTLPDLSVAQGRTTLDLTGDADDASGNFRCVLGGNFDCDSIKPFLPDTNAVRSFNHLYFRQPAALVLDVTGNLHDFAALSVTGRVVATDFAIRGQFVDSLTTVVTYTNLTAEFLHPQLVREEGREKFAAEKATLDIAGKKLFIHHGQGHITPLAVGNSIGPKTASQFAPYEFLALPEATADGCIPLKMKGDDLIPDDADIWFNVVGTVPFRWRKFETPHITGSIHWLANHLILTNLVADCYGGSAQGWGDFNVTTPGDGTDFSFFVDGTNVDFNAMGRALWSPTNQLRGSLSGQVTISSANSSDWRTWNGYGQAQLHNGLIWDAPVLGGLVSPILNRLTPGLDVGSSRATDGAGRFVMNKGVIYTDSLEIRSLTMRLNYVGTVDLQENVNARATAQLLRNTPVIGSFFSTLLWPVSKASECQVTGTLERPKIVPLYIPFPNLLAAPLHPLRTVQGIFASPQTNNLNKP